jgi:uncharacterized protein (TIGR02271 family)
VVVDSAGIDTDRAVTLLNEYGAADVNSDIENGINDATTRRAGTPSGAGASLPVVDEELQIGKRSIQRGGVRVYSRITERPVEEQITLHDEHVRVERRPVDRPISEAELSALRDQSFEVTETVEEAVIQKRARVTEEVVVGKEATERTQKVRDTVRRTDVNVERFGAGGAADYEQDFRDDWQRNYASDGGDYSMYAPAYDYGYRTASDQQYQGRSWNDVEPDLRRDYERQYPESAWERMKNAIRHGWEKATGKR